MKNLIQQVLVATLLFGGNTFTEAEAKANNQVEMATPLQTRVLVKVIPDCTVIRPQEVPYGDISKGVTRMPFSISISCKPLTSSHLSVEADYMELNYDNNAVDFGENSKLEIFENGKLIHLDGTDAVCSGLNNRRCQFEGRVTIAQDATLTSFSTWVVFNHVID